MNKNITRRQMAGLIVLGILAVSLLELPLMQVIPLGIATSADWWNISWPYRKTISLNSAKVPSNLLNFPLLVSLDVDSGLASNAKNNGQDIVFTDTNQTKLSHEIELYVAASGRLVAWVNLPSVSSTSNTTLYMYYGNQFASPQWDPAGVWDANFMEVHHLSGASADAIDDSTGNNNDVTGSSGSGVLAYDIEAQIGKGMVFHGNAGLIIGDADTLDGYPSAATFEAWVASDNYSLPYQGMLSKWATGGKSWFLEIENKKVLLYFTADGSNTKYQYCTYTFQDGNWYHIAAMWRNNATPVFYVNGQQQASYGTGMSSAIYSGGASHTIGVRGYNYFDGKLDECRISNIERSAAWILASFNNQNDPKSFVTLGQETTPGNTPPIINNPYPPDGATSVPVSLPRLSFTLSDLDGDRMNYNVTMVPDKIGGVQSGTNVSSGTIVNIAMTQPLENATFYTWVVKAIDPGGSGTTTSATFSFTTQNPYVPVLISSGGTNSTDESLICYNQSLAEPHSNPVANIYNWYKADKSLSNLLMPFDTSSPSLAKDYSKNGNDGVVQGASWASKGVIGGAYAFNGLNNWISVSDSASLGGDGTWTELSIEFWVKVSSSLRGTRIIAKKSASSSTGSYMVGFQTSTGDPANCVFFGITTRGYGDLQDPAWVDVYDTTSTVLAVGGWYHIVCTYKSGIGLTIYINGTQKAQKYLVGTIYSETPVFNDEPLLIGGFNDGRNRYLNGTLDSVAIYPRALTAEQVIQNNVQSRNGFSNSSTIVPQETAFGELETWKCEVTPSDGAVDFPSKFSNSLTVTTYEPIVLNENPLNGASHVSDSLSQLSFDLKDLQGDKMNYTVVTSPNIGSGSGINVGNGKRTVNLSGVTIGTAYSWEVTVTDGVNWIIRTFKFTTLFLKPKWTASNLPEGFSGVLVGDLVGDSKEEVIHAGTGRVTCLNGTDGQEIWRYENLQIGMFCQPQMADLNKDGKLEVVVPLEFPAGISVLFGNSGSVYWSYSRLCSGSVTSSPVVGDIDGEGYQTVFIGAEDADEPYEGMLTKLSYNGTILAQAFAYRPCSGGFSLADVDNDGDFELFFGDRTSPKPYARSVVAFDADTLQVLWDRSDLGGAFSSHCPMLADVNKDGVLEVIVEDQRGGLFILNATNGQTIKGSSTLNLPTHYQPSIYDIDYDGNLEILLADGEHSSTPSDIRVWDLVQSKEDGRIDVGLCIYPPQVAEVTGDGFMDAIACNYTGVFIIGYDQASKKFSVIDEVTGLAGYLTYAVTQDADQDGLNEVFVQSMGGKVYAFDTVAQRPNPRARSEVQFYSERRLGAAEYVSPPGSQAPIVSNVYPLNGAKDVTPALTELSYNLVDFQGDKMNYAVITSPNIGSGSGTNVGNGKCTVNVGGLESGKTYTWKVNVTDGTNWTNMTFTFKTQAQPWWNASWLYRKPIMINPSKISADQTIFPLLIDIIDADLASKAQSDGDDIVFVNSNQVKLSHEIELYNSATGRLVAWVKIPLLSSTAYTTIYMYYGNSTLSSQQDPTNVWNTSFVEVQHLNGAAATTLDDSTVNHNDVTGQTGTPDYNIPSKIGNGVELVPNEALTINDADTLDGYTSAATFEAWVASDNYKLTQTIVSKWTSAGKSWFIEIQYTGSTNKVLFYFTEDGSTAKYVYCNFAFQDGKWYHIAVVWKKNAVPTFYINGALQLTIGSSKTVGIYAGAANQYIGSRGYNYFDGKIDEVRISNIDRSASWILTCFNNQNDPVSFYTIQAEQGAS